MLHGAGPGPGLAVLVRAEFARCCLLGTACPEDTYSQCHPPLARRPSVLGALAHEARRKLAGQPPPDNVAVGEGKALKQIRELAWARNDLAKLTFALTLRALCALQVKAATRDNWEVGVPFPGALHC